MIHFTVIRWKNVLSTGNVWTEIELDKYANVLMVGENGAGKSTLLDALCFGLYGKPYRNINKPQLVNTINGRDCVVEVEFKIGANNYKIIRGIKPNIFEIYRSGILINQDPTIGDYQEVLEKQILQIGFRSFCQVVILGSAAFVPFMQLPAQHRREVVEDILDIAIFSRMNGIHKAKVAQNDENLNIIRYEIRLLDEKIKMSEEHTKELQVNAQDLIDKKLHEIVLLEETVVKNQDILEMIKK